jgi:hypothetical protein
MKPAAIPQHKNVLFLLEEQSAEAMLKEFLPRCFPTLRCTYRRFSDVNELLKRLEKTIRNHTDTECPIIILCDQDDKDCVKFKKHISGLCKKTRQESRCIIRIACHELESWYLAQLDVVANHFGVPELSKRQNRYSNPDNTNKPSKELERLTKQQYQKIKGSRIMGKHLDPEVKRSVSFKHFIQTLREIS